jgi:hypothetical protein
MLIASRFQKRWKEARMMRRVLIATSLIAGLCLVGPISAHEAAKEGAKKVGNTVTGTGGVKSWDKY